MAKRKTKQFGTDVNIFDMVIIIKEHFLRLSGDTTWFHDYLDAKMKVAFGEDYTVFVVNNFLTISTMPL